ncbi:MAG: ferric reductase-like transmembrane domain-containing protein [Firmicutes bacterium]|nr:ferric reductase-like transmembrane domain-containing protein [Bacillota bacterium]
MTELLGGIGLVLLISTLLPYVLRRLRLWETGASFFARCHHWLALTGTSVLTLHGLLALTGRRNRWGYGQTDRWDSFLGGGILTGLISWLLLLAIVILAMQAVKKKPFPRTHCWLVGLLVVMLIFHL